jgi:hypothetical protein
MKNAACPFQGWSEMAKHEKEKPVPSYSVGYGKPPAHTRYKKGQSGNPAGRRKGSKNFSTVLLEALQETVVIQQNGKTKKISKQQAAVKQAVHKAASGDLRAFSLIASLTTQIEQSAEREPNSAIVLNEQDKKVILSLFKRYEKPGKE